ncbi:MAG TPA: polysulfide reductase NrfD [Pirellulaceae bacterium]|nr:polysulfide reductase NrfD [Pirellulaceae bacterium]HMP69512.1 polysulfide reductase NrfD [Pirellulaceae bacterium]
MKANEITSQPLGAAETRSYWASYPRFLWQSLRAATDGSAWFYGWMTLLTAVALVGVNGWAHQFSNGMIVTHMTDHVSWGLYIANFTFGVGLAAGGVMMVIPAYLYRNRHMHDVVILGELLAVAAIVICTLFIVVDLGRPDRFWHIIPGLGRFNWPISMLTWDVIVLNGYLLLNLHICGYLLYTKFQGRTPNKWWYIPFVFLSIVWAISIHTVTAFLYQGLGGRPFWNTALLAPRFLASAFVSGPIFLILTMLILKKIAGLQLPSQAIKLLVQIVRVTILINLLMVASELFTEFYTGAAHSVHAYYLFFGLHGHAALVPWIWTAIVLNVFAAILFLNRSALESPVWLTAACLMGLIGIWIEKGMGLIIPGFVPSTLHQLVEYTPSLTEWQITAGIWAFGLMVYSVGLKIAIPIFRTASQDEQDLVQ